MCGRGYSTILIFKQLLFKTVTFNDMYNASSGISRTRKDLSYSNDVLL